MAEATVQPRRPNPTDLHRVCPEEVSVNIYIHTYIHGSVYTSIIHIN